jgi:hypothetical protein
MPKPDPKFPSRIDVHLHGDGQLFSRLDEILAELEAIRNLLTPKVPTAMSLKFGQPVPTTPKGDSTMSTSPVPGVETDVQTIPCSALETDDDGNPVTLNPANVTWSITPGDDGIVVASVSQQPDGSAQFKALAVGGPAVVSCVDNGSKLPDGTFVTGTNTLTVNKSTKTASKMALLFGDPQAATA